MATDFLDEPSLDEDQSQTTAEEGEQKVVDLVELSREVLEACKARDAIKLASVLSAHSQVPLFARDDEQV